MKAYERSAADRKADAAERKRGVKEGSPQDRAADRKGLAAMRRRKGK